MEREDAKRGTNQELTTCSSSKLRRESITQFLQGWPPHRVVDRRRRMRFAESKHRDEIVFSEHVVPGVPVCAL